jgi:hypothetical protein
MNRVRVAALLAAVVLGAAACNGGGDAQLPTSTLPAITNLRGEVILNGANFVRGNLADCAGAGPYADLVTNAPVLVNDPQGRPLAVGKILFAVGTNVYLNQLDQCTFKIEVQGIPRYATYQIVVAQQKPFPATFFDIWTKQGQISWSLNRAPGSPTTTTTRTPGTSTTTSTIPGVTSSTTTTTIPLPGNPRDPAR